MRDGKLKKKMNEINKEMEWIFCEIFAVAAYARRIAILFFY